MSKQNILLKLLIPLILLIGISYEASALVPITKTMYGFSSFQLLSDESTITGVNYNDSIALSYNGASIESEITETWYTDFDEYGNCTDFSIEIAMFYNYTGNELLGSFNLTLFSYYDEPRNLYSTNLTNDDGFQLAGLSYTDNWGANNGRVGVSGFPNDVQESHNTDYIYANKTGEFVFRAIRISNNLTLSIESNDTVQLVYTWTSGVSKPLNALRIGVNTFPADNDFFYVEFSDLTTIVSYDYFPSNFFGFNPMILLPSLIALFGTTYLIKKKKKNM